MFNDFIDIWYSRSFRLAQALQKQRSRLFVMGLIGYKMQFLFENIYRICYSIYYDLLSVYYFMLPTSFSNFNIFTGYKKNKTNNNNNFALARSAHFASFGANAFSTCRTYTKVYSHTHIGTHIHNIYVCMHICIQLEKPAKSNILRHNAIGFWLSAIDIKYSVCSWQPLRMRNFVHYVYVIA